jgi:hypothetical protein
MNQPVMIWDLNSVLGVQSSVHMNIAFPLSTLKGLIAESFELVPASGLLNLLPCSKNALQCIQAFYIFHVSSLKRTWFTPCSCCVIVRLWCLLSKEGNFSLPWMGTTDSCMHKMRTFCIISTMKQTGNGVEDKGRLSILFPRCFTMLPSEGKRTIARALRMQSVRPCDKFVIGNQVEKLDWCFGRGR